MADGWQERQSLVSRIQTGRGTIPTMSSTCGCALESSADLTARRRLGIPPPREEGAYLDKHAATGYGQRMSSNKPRPFDRSSDDNHEPEPLVEMTSRKQVQPVIQPEVKTTKVPPEKPKQAKPGATEQGSPTPSDKQAQEEPGSRVSLAAPRVCCSSKSRPSAP
jgi:hypothetical protein